MGLSTLLPGIHYSPGLFFCFLRCPIYLLTLSSPGTTGPLNVNVHFFQILLHYLLQQLPQPHLLLIYPWILKIFAKSSVTVEFSLVRLVQPDQREFWPVNLTSLWLFQIVFKLDIWWPWISSILCMRFFLWLLLRKVSVL